MSLSIGEHVRRLFAHMEWADRRLVEMMDQSAPARTDAAVRLFAHLLAAERIWLVRLRGEDSTGEPLWPQPPASELRAAAEANREGYARYLASLGDDELDAEVAYTNQRGDPFRTRRVDILTHVAMHGAYHRGQIAAVVRAAGGEPVGTDYIIFARENP
jgi:uncharacterized damage-inducible protein DinB